MKPSGDLLWLRQMMTPDLAATADMLRADLADAPEFYRDDKVAGLRLQYLIDQVEAELARRRRLAELGQPVHHPDRYETWRLLAGAVREQVNLVDYCERRGLALRRTGRGEWHGACPLCRDGDDRFTVWPERGRWWCRRCACRGDVITLHRSLTGAEFCEALIDLARLAGLPLPKGAAA